MTPGRQSGSEGTSPREKFKELLDARMKAAGIKPSKLANAANTVLRSRKVRRALTPQQISQFRRTDDPELRVPRQPEVLHAICEGLDRLNAWAGNSVKRAEEIAGLFEFLQFPVTPLFPELAESVSLHGAPAEVSDAVFREPSTKFVDALMAQSRLIFCSTVLDSPDNANVLRLPDARNVFFGHYLLKRNLWIGVSPPPTQNQTPASSLKFDDLPALFRAYVYAVLVYIAELKQANSKVQVESVLTDVRQNLHFLMPDAPKHEHEHTYCCAGRVYFLCLRRGYGIQTSVPTFRADWPATFRRAIWTPDLMGEYAKDADVFDPRRGLQLDTVAGRAVEVEHAPGASIVGAMAKWLREVVGKDGTKTRCYQFRKFESDEALQVAIDKEEPILVSQESNSKE